MSDHEFHEDALHALYVCQRRHDAGQGDERTAAIIAARHDGGFHRRNDTYFKRLEDGSVRLRTFSVLPNGWPDWTDRTIPAAEWASIVSSVSAEGETSERWNAAQDFHGRPTA